jgi:hypothetical protein
MNDGTDNEIGYGKPPKHTRFTKGKSGNPKGRPKGSQNFMTLLRDELNVKIHITENGKRRKITKQEAMVKQLANKGAAGDLKALPLLLSEIRLREGLSEPVPASSVREEDQKVMENIMKRMNNTDEEDAGSGSKASEKTNYTEEK